MGWKELKSLGLPLLTAITAFLGILGGFIYTYGVDLAEGADTSAAFVWTLKGVAGAVIFASLAPAAAAVDVLIPPGVRQSRIFSLVVAFFTAVVLVLAGWYVGSVASSLGGGNQPVGSSAYARKMSVVLSEIAGGQSDANHSLRQVDSGALQASVAAGFARLISNRVTAVRAMYVDGDERDATAAVATRIDGLADAYTSLAAAAKNPDGSQEALDRARRKVSEASERLWTAESELEDHGYDVVVIGQSNEKRIHVSS
jgi:hypothetical protein